MAEITLATKVTLRELEKNFQLTLVTDAAFFPEWQSGLPEITEQEKQMLDKVKAGFLNLVRYQPVHEHIAQIAVTSPLLFLANFFLPPFHVTAEKVVSVSERDEGQIVKGKIDVLVLKENLWVMVIESKRMAFSLEVGLAQLLAYMLANPAQDQASFGLITNGASFMFVKVAYRNPPRYGCSRVFELRNPGNELYSVLAILKKFHDLFNQPEND